MGAAALCVACRPARSHPPVVTIGRVEVTGLRGSDLAQWNAGREEVREIFIQALLREGRVDFANAKRPTSAPVSPWQVSLALVPSSGGLSAEVSLHQAEGEAWHHELGTFRPDGPKGKFGPGDLRGAMKQAAHVVFLRLSALQKTNGELLRDLASKDGCTSASAVDVLAERGNAAAVPVLLENLTGEDREGVRHAMGALVEMREPRAVPALIELARGQDSFFLREIVYAVGSIGGLEAEAYLDTMAEGHDDPSIRAAARESLAQLRSARSMESHRPTSPQK
jgi:hypothetical protein